MARLYPEAAQNAAVNPMSRAEQEDTITTPPPQDFDTPAMAGSMQQFLSENLGQYVVVEFLVGTQKLETKAGVLYAVGTSVLTLYQELTQTFVTCDIFSIKFVTFYLPGHRPWQVNFPRQAAVSPAQMPMAQIGIAPGFAPAGDIAPVMGGGCAGSAGMPTWG